MQGHVEHTPTPLPVASTWKRLLGYGLAAVLLFGFLALGTWQVFRLGEKLELIDRVETRVDAPAVAPPPMADWPLVSKASHEYLPVRFEGQFLMDLTTRVQATTALGKGHWLLTPLRTAEGTAIWVNRGFIAPNQIDALSERDPNAKYSVSGLLRITEPEGAFLRTNDPQGNRWYSRDIAALNQHHGLERAAPYFVDAGRPRNLGEEILGFTPETYPVDGLTVIKFKNNHVVYAVTWYALALMVLGITVWLSRRQKRE